MVMAMLVACASSKPARRTLVTDHQPLGSDRATVTAWYEAHGWCGKTDAARTIYRRCEGKAEPYEIQLGFDADEHLITVEARYPIAGRPNPPPTDRPGTSPPADMPSSFNNRSSGPHPVDARFLDLAAELEARHGAPALTTSRGKLWRLPDHEIEVFIAPSRWFVVERHSRMPGSGGVTTTEPAPPASSP